MPAKFTSTAKPARLLFAFATGSPDETISTSSHSPTSCVKNPFRRMGGAKRYPSFLSCTLRTLGSSLRSLTQPTFLIINDRSDKPAKADNSAVFVESCFLPLRLNSPTTRFSEICLMRSFN